MLECQTKKPPEMAVFLFGAPPPNFLPEAVPVPFILVVI